MKARSVRVSEPAEAMREASAKLIETFPEQILAWYSRGPGSPPGNGYRATTRADLAAAIRGLPKGCAGADGLRASQDLQLAPALATDIEFWIARLANTRTGSAHHRVAQRELVMLIMRERELLLAALRSAAPLPESDTGGKGAA